jgi:ABC-2 type transport system permease protein
MRCSYDGMRGPDVRVRPVMKQPCLAVLALALQACGSNTITAGRVEAAFAPTFANLIQVQESKLGLPTLDVTAFQASAACHRIGPGNEPSGSGNWLCTVEWTPPGHQRPWRDTYELSVTMDGCYTATADTEENHLGGPRLTTRDGSTTTNLLYAFDGCFDTT